MTDSPTVPEGVPHDHAPGSPMPPPPQEGTAGDPVINTSNERLDDGVNRCPKCGSTDIQLRVSTGMLICLFCRHEWAEQQIESIVAEDQAIGDLTGTVIASGATNIEADANTLTMKCAGCGAEVVVNLTEATSSRCHWCRHVLTVNQQVPNGAVPDAVLPFSITREQAVAHIEEFAGKRRTFADRRFLADFSPENVVGVYLPYMVVDGNVSAEVHGQGEVETRRYTRGTGDDKETVYDADIYSIDRQVDYTVDDLTLESSTERADMNVKVNTNNVINTILPFDTKNAVQWNANYLVGYTSERRDQDVDAMRPQLEHQLLSIARSEVQGSVKRFDRGVRWESERLMVHGTRWVSMYLPVWLYSYYHEKGGQGFVHYIAVNGRNGETMGSIPVSHGRLAVAAVAAGTVIEGLAIGILVATS